MRSLAFVLLLSLSARLTVADTESSRSTLEGLEGVGVWTSAINEPRLGVLQSDLQTRIELRLRKAGVPVYTKTQFDADALQPGIYFAVNALPASSTGESFAIVARLEFMQNVLRVQKGGRSSMISASTWSTSRMLLYGTDALKSDGVARVADALVDEFVNAWFATHPSRK